jgi:hypothetical protein
MIFRSLSNFIWALDFLINEEKIDENDIVVSRLDVPKFWYETNDHHEHIYFIDIYIKSQKRCIEVKSQWTYTKDKQKILLTEQVITNSEYNFEVWIFNRKKKRYIIPKYLFELSIYNKYGEEDDNILA